MKKDRKAPLSLLLALMIPAYLSAEGVHRVHLTLPSGEKVLGKLEKEAPGRALLLRNSQGDLKEYPLTDGTRYWKEWVQVPSETFPPLPGLFSAVFPGLGQHYNGQAEKGFWIEGICLTGLVVGGMSGFSGPRDETLYGVGFGVFLAAYSFGIGDAVLSAFLRNDERRKSLYGPDARASLTLTPAFAQGLGLAARLEL